MQTDSIFADYETYANKKYQVGESNKLEKINATLQRKDTKNTSSTSQYTGINFIGQSCKSGCVQPSNIKHLQQIMTALPPINLSDTALINKHPVLQYYNATTNYCQSNNGSI